MACNLRRCCVKKESLTPPVVHGQWSSGLYDCCSGEDALKTCLLSTCLPCVQYGQNVSRLQPEDGVLCAGDCFGAGMTFFALQLAPGGYHGSFGCNAIAHMHTRAALRKKYGIPSDGCHDFFTTFFCSPCALAQEHRHLTSANNYAKLPSVDVAFPATHSPLYTPLPPAYTPPQPQSYIPTPPAYTPPGPTLDAYAPPKAVSDSPMPAQDPRVTNSIIYTEAVVGAPAPTPTKY